MDPTGSAPDVPTVNEVRLVGRVSAGAQERELPSGQRLVTFRLVVPREPVPVGRRRGAPSRAAVDTIQVSCWTGRLRRQALALRASDIVEVNGCLRRSFFASADGKVSRYEVEAATMTRRARAAGGASRRAATTSSKSGEAQRDTSSDTEQ